MAFSYTIDAANRLARATLSGTVHGTELVAGARAIYKDPAWRPGFDTLWECTGITQLLLERDDIPSIVAVHERMSDRAGDGLEVIVVSRSLDHVMARMYSVWMRSQKRNVHVCRTVIEASQLLGRPVS